MNIGIGYKVRRSETGEAGSVTTFYDDGDLMVRLPDGSYVRWAVEECVGWRV